MPKKGNQKASKGVVLGQAFLNVQKRQATEQRNRGLTEYVMEQNNECTSSSVLEQTSIDDLIATVEITKQRYAERYGEADIVDEGPVIIDLSRVVEQERTACSNRELLQIPRRPKWKDDSTVESFTADEREMFTEWRREINDVAREAGLQLTPFEKNLDFWRQLWRCVERSDLLVQILDARDPDFYYCRDLVRLVTECGANKRMMLLVNKADFLTPEQRTAWVAHFASLGVDAVFFSALRELRRQEKEQAPVAAVTAIAKDSKLHGDTDAASRHSAAVDTQLPGSDDDADGESESKGGGDDKVDDDDATGASPLGPLRDDDLSVADCTRLLEEITARLAPIDATEAPVAGSRGHLRTVGFVGYPNVGKSTVINALLGTRKVAMSKRPGKTKHLQTLDLHEAGITLCDCPGLVFPSVVATRAHLVINNTVPLDDLKECWTPVRLIIEKMGLEALLAKYRCAAFYRDAAKRKGVDRVDEAHGFLCALANARNHVLWVGVPDEQWAARKVLREYVSGELLHCEPPPSGWPGALADAVTPAGAGYGAGEAPLASSAADDDDDDFGDLDTFLAAGQKPRRMTKRKERMMNKQLGKGRAPPTYEGPEVGVTDSQARCVGIPVG